jgi:hypothetical protein
MKIIFIFFLAIVLSACEISNDDVNNDDNTSPFTYPETCTHGQNILSETNFELVAGETYGLCVYVKAGNIVKIRFNDYPVGTDMDCVTQVKNLRNWSTSCATDIISLDSSGADFDEMNDTGMKIIAPGTGSINVYIYENDPYLNNNPTRIKHYTW